MIIEIHIESRLFAIYQLTDSQRINLHTIDALPYFTELYREQREILWCTRALELRNDTQPRVIRKERVGNAKGEEASLSSRCFATTCAANYFVSITLGTAMFIA